ncbi:hypothetical protein HNQ80_004917 [Anaerosolibacter carboniphilus]|uniref:Uncharacterized protein n=1 Tax=Anaerosolibacter carboniphilus TaxID=1417629 RepID=A0A841L6M7_9FIRM|nr:hypothetical protein [Anaerosolibacter carboniphilus]
MHSWIMQEVFWHNCKQISQADLLSTLITIVLLKSEMKKLVYNFSMTNEDPRYFEAAEKVKTLS